MIRKIFIGITSLILLLLLNMSIAKGETITKFSWYITDDIIQGINPFLTSALPDALIVQPGIYSYNNTTYDMTAEGLYRFAEVNGVNRQCIVYQNNIHKLLSSLSWISTHGNSDSSLTYDSLKDSAKTRKIYVTCGKLVGLAQNILTTSVPTRKISLYALDNITGFDDGHVLLEVWRSDLNKWVLYDLDNNFVFTDNNGVLLSLWEVLAVVNSDNYNMKPISVDTPLDISNFKTTTYDYGLYTETVISNKYNWLKRVFAFPTIVDNGVYYGVDSSRTRDLTAADITYLTGLGINYQVLSETDFLNRFYPIQ